MGRQWKIREQSFLEGFDLPSQLKLLENETGLSPVTLQVCISRGMLSKEAIQDHLSPGLENLKNPFSIQDMDRAVDRLIHAFDHQESLRVFGDYDVDGTTGAALLAWVFRDLGFQYSVVQPDRFKDGYGLNVQAVEAAALDGVKVLMTVDCGITSFEAAERAQVLGVDLIIVDHHQVDPLKGLPPALAVVNPQRPDCTSGLRQLCGCGLAFFVALALRAKGRDAGWFVTRKEPNLKAHLDLVVLATAADQVPLTADNRILVKHGLDVLKRTQKPGLKALLEVSGLASRNLSPGSLGFVLGPRINASGRMQTASLALELLTTQDSSQGLKLAQELEKLNQERSDVQNLIWDEVRGRVEKGIAEGLFEFGVVVADPGWHEGVIGIVASRITETFYRPAIIISVREDFGKGSARTFAGKDVLAAIRACSDFLIGFGGHRHAAGLSIKPEQIESFTLAFNEAIKSLPIENVDGAPLWVEGQVELKDFDLRTLQELENLAPFGPGNPEPVFIVRAAMKNKRVLKERHLKMSLCSTAGEKDAASLEAIWFHGAEKKDALSEMELDQVFEWAGVPEINRFQGRVTPSFRIKDRRKTEAD